LAENVTLPLHSPVGVIETGTSAVVAPHMIRWAMEGP
jgi:hypothetical protein